MSTKMRELLAYLEERRASVEVRGAFDGRTIRAAEKRGYIMESAGDGGLWFMRTDVGAAALLVEEAR